MDWKSACPWFDPRRYHLKKQDDRLPTQPAVFFSFFSAHTWPHAKPQSVYQTTGTTLLTTRTTFFIGHPRSFDFTLSRHPSHAKSPPISRKVAKPLSVDVIARKCSQEIEQKYILPRSGRKVASKRCLTFFSFFFFFFARTCAIVGFEVSHLINCCHITEFYYLCPVDMATPMCRIQDIVE